MLGRNLRFAGPKFSGIAHNIADPLANMFPLAAFIPSGNPDISASPKPDIMTKLIVFNQVSLDGFIADAKGDMAWAHRDDAEWKAFSSENAMGEAMLLFGRVTYQMMASFWPTPYALQISAEVAKRMNSLPKVVFSRTLETASWNNTKLVNSDLAGEVRKMKKDTGPQMVVMGSGSIVSQLAQEGLVDEFQIVVNPIVLGNGKSMFAGIKERLKLKPTRTRAFANGNILLCYEPAA